MRVRILKPIAGVLDGHSLARLIPGFLYEVDDVLARQLIAMGGAKEETSDGRELVSGGTDDGLGEALTGGIHVVHAATADDRPEESTADRRRNAGDRRRFPRTDRRRRHL